MIKGLATINGKPANAKGQLWTYKGILHDECSPCLRLNGHTLPISFFTQYDCGLTYIILGAPELNITIHIFITDRSAIAELFDVCANNIKTEA